MRRAGSPTPAIGLKINPYEYRPESYVLAPTKVRRERRPSADAPIDVPNDTARTDREQSGGHTTHDRSDKRRDTGGGQLRSRSQESSDSARKGCRAQR